MSNQLPKEKVEKFRELLESKRSALLKELEYLEAANMKSTMTEASGDITSYSYHMADQGTDAMEREKAFLFVSREGRFLYHLDKALERIEAGTYGLCEECGRPIPDERLEAVPHARLCISCKATEDDRKAASA